MVGGSGEPGSFFTTILGGTPALREALGGDDFAFEDAAPLGLPFPERCADALGVPDDAAAGGGGGGSAVRCADGEERDDDDDDDVVVVCFKSAPYEGRSWGAGEGAIAMAVLMVDALRKVVGPSVSRFFLRVPVECGRLAGGKKAIANKGKCRAGCCRRC